MWRDSLPLVGQGLGQYYDPMVPLQGQEPCQTPVLPAQGRDPFYTPVPQAQDVPVPHRHLFRTRLATTAFMPSYQR